MKNSRLWVFIAVSWLAPLLSAPGQISILGRRPEDKFLTNFWSQHLNASNAVAGLNNHASTTSVKFADALLPPTLTGKILSGSFTGTNTFKLLSWDTITASLQSWEFALTNNLPVGTNTVSRTGFPEPLLYKTLYSAIFGTAGNPNTFLSGILKANNGNAATAIAGAAGTNKVWVRITNGALANYIGVIDGVVAELTFPTNTELATTGWVNSQIIATGAGDVRGPSLVTASQIARFRDTSGKVITNSVITIDDAGNISSIASLTASGLVSAKNFVPAASTIAYAASVALDFSGDGVRTINLGGNIAFSSLNLAPARTLTLRLIGDGSQRGLSFPAWKFLGAAAPAFLPANKTAVITATSFASDDANVVAAYSATP